MHSGLLFQCIEIVIPGMKLSFQWNELTKSSTLSNKLVDFVQQTRRLCKMISMEWEPHFNGMGILFR